MWPPIWANLTGQDGERESGNRTVVYLGPQATVNDQKSGQLVPKGLKRGENAGKIPTLQLGRTAEAVIGLVLGFRCLS